MKIKQLLKRPALAGVALVSLAAASASWAYDQPVFGMSYSPVPTPAANQAQVVYYRPADDMTDSQALRVRVDGRLQAALLPGAFSVFCLRPGEYRFAQSSNDLVDQAEARAVKSRMSGGDTYFLRASSDNARIQEVPRAQAEQELAGANRQINLVSRAPVVTCTIPEGRY